MRYIDLMFDEMKVETCLFLFSFVMHLYSAHPGIYKKNSTW